jgi:hypothetical protein
MNRKTHVPGIACVALIWVLTEQLLVTVGMTPLAILALSNVMHPNPQTQHLITEVSVRPGFYEAVIITKIERPWLTLYCYPSVNIMDRHTKCWRIISTSFNVYTLRSNANPELKRVATISLGNHVTNHFTSSPYERKSANSVAVKAWTNDGDAYLLQSEENNDYYTTYIVNIPGNTLTATSGNFAPLDLRLDNHPGVPSECYLIWGNQLILINHDKLIYKEEGIDNGSLCNRVMG